MFGAHGFARAAGRHIFRALAAAGGQPQLLLESQGVRLTDAFSDAMAELVSGVCVVRAAGRDGAPCGLVATSLCSYSADPPTVLVCVGRHGPARAALAPAFGVHVLCDEHQDVAHWFATNGSARPSTGPGTRAFRRSRRLTSWRTCAARASRSSGTATTRS